MTRNDAVSWLKSQVGQHLDYDHEYGDQCVDFWAYYYVHLTGKEFFAAGQGVTGAKDIWSKNLPEFTKVANNPNDPNQLPQPGDVMIYGSSWGGGYGHVDVCLSANQSGVTAVGENEHGNPSEGVIEITRSWNQIVGGLIGWLSFNNFAEPTPMITLAQLTELYETLLGRQPDPSGVQHYVGHYTYDFTLNDIKNSAEYKADQAAKSAPTPPVAQPVTPPKETPSEPVKTTPAPTPTPTPKQSQPANPPAEPPVQKPPVQQPPVTPPKPPKKSPTAPAKAPTLGFWANLWQILLDFLTNLFKRS